MKNRNILFVILTFLTVTTYGQTRTIKGVTIDKGRDPIIGCNVFIKGTTNGTTTDTCGEFELKTNLSDMTIVFSCLSSDMRAFEANVKTTDFNEGDRVIFHLSGHWKAKNKDCKKAIDKGLKRYTID